MMRVFISYRRSDTQHLAGRIADRLRRDKNIGEVFLDVDGILPGEDFEAKIETAIAQSSACLLLIGPNWLGRDGEKARIFDQRDFIRLETRAALASRRQVVPVLVEDTAMPPADDLPDDLRQLPRLSGISIRHQHFDKDIESLLDALLGRERTPGTQSASPVHILISHLFRGFLGFCIAAIALIGLAFTHNVMTDGQSLEESFGGSAQVFLLIIGILAIGAFTPSAVQWIRRRHR